MSEQIGTPLPMPENNEWEEEINIIENKVDAPEDESEESEDIEDEPEEVETPLPPVPTIPDPGEFTPKDHSFEVTIFDEEGKRGKVVKIKSPEQFDELTDADANFGTGGALAKAIRMASNMEKSMEDDKRDWQTKKEAFDSEKAILESRTQALNAMQSEMDYLVQRGDLPKLTSEQKNADWNDPEVSKVPGVKAQKDLINYMSKENRLREKAGLKPMTSILDAFNAYQLDKNKRQETSQKTRQAQQRKEVGAKVGSSSPNPMTIAPKGIAVGRVGGMNDSGW